MEDSGRCGALNCFIYEDAILSADWIGEDFYTRFFSLFPYNRKYRSTIESYIDKSILYNDFTNKEELLIKHINSLLHLFDTEGVYNVTFSNATERTYFTEKVRNEVKKVSCNFLIAKALCNQNEEKKIIEYTYYKNNTPKDEHYQQNILHYTTNRYCTLGYPKALLATYSRRKY